LAGPSNNPCTESSKKPSKEPKEGKAKGKDGKGKEAKGKEAKGKEGKGKEAKGKEAKGKEAKGKEVAEGKGKEAKGKEGKGKEGKGKEAKGKDGAAGKGKEKGAKGAAKGSGPTAGGNGYRLNVKNLGKMTEEELKSCFEQFGAVSMAEIKKDDKGASRGLGFVVLPSEKEGLAAAKEMNGKEINGTKLVVAAAERRPVEEEDGKGKGKGKLGIQPAQPQYYSTAQQQWAAYSQYTQMVYMQQYAAMQQQQQSLWAKHSAAAASAQAAASPGKEYEGSLKSVSNRNGYGFIVCQETAALFGGRDVYVDKSVLPEGAERGSRLLFTAIGNEKGHPKAVTCRLAV